MYLWLVSASTAFKKPPTTRSLLSLAVVPGIALTRRLRGPRQRSATSFREEQTHSTPNMRRLSPDKNAALRVVFDMNIVIHGCSNIPHPDTSVFFKWKLTTAVSEHHGVSEASEVSSTNKVVWDAPVAIHNCSLKLDPSTKTPKPCHLRISVRQVTRTGLKGFTRLGVVTVDLAEYLDGNQIKRTYLLENSRLNSTLDITICSQQVRGDVMFRRKSLSSPSRDITSPEKALLRRKPSTTKLATEQSVFKAVEDVVRELEEQRARPTSVQHPTLPFTRTQS